MIKEEKTLLQLVRRYETSPFSAQERFGIGILISFFLAMSTLFILIPKIF
ncbi:MAG: hypothetical protein JNL88_01035 [Bacteroidia bacterium]|nr:hypothetical protein [Bacteroidia bacterium]